MQDNSSNKKKTLVISVLAFLLAGGGVFLFFIIQGSNELTGAGKSNFHYGEAAREGVSSFFKSIGLVPDENASLSKYKENVLVAREVLSSGQGDLSDWMTNSGAAGGGPSGSPSRSPGASVVPKMSGSGGSSGGGSGGGTKSSGGSSRFGDGNTAGSVNVSARSQGGEGGAGGKGSLGALKNARAMLGDGLRSNSAMTARSKWGQSFGVGSTGGGSGRDPAYGKTGLVNLDKIKSGEIASLKAAPETGAFERDKEAEKKDPGIQAAQAKAKADAEQQAKLAAIQAGVNAAGDAASGSNSKPNTGGGNQNDTAAPSANPNEPTTAVANSARNLAFPSDKPASGPPLPEGDSFHDNSMTFVKNEDGSFNVTYNTVYTPAGGEPMSIPNTVKFSADGKPLFP